MRVLLFGARGRVGRVLGPKLAEAGHELTDVERADSPSFDGQDVAIDFTRPDAVRANVERCLDAGIPCIVGTSGLGLEDIVALDAALMMRFSGEAAKHFSKAEIVELHHEAKLDAPSGTAKATAELLPGEVPIHSVRLPGLLAHQEVLFGGDGQLLTIRHDAYSRDAYVPGVLLALEKLSTLPPG